MELLSQNGINVEYLYAFPERDSVENAIMVFRFDDNDKAIALMQQNGIRILEASRVYTI